MRITGGHARGISLKLPARGEIRPATDYLREAVFSSLGARVEAARVLDLFAGTGAYGLEALSRGAQSACFVEKNPAAIRAIEANIAAVAKAMSASPRFPAGSISHTVRKEDVLRWEPGARYDLIFCDPPWALWQNEALPLLLKFPAWVADSDARVILECPGGWTPPPVPGWQVHRHLAKGKDQPAAIILKQDNGTIA